jgi:hypothetical protein
MMLGFVLRRAPVAVRFARLMKVGSAHPESFGLPRHATYSGKNACYKVSRREGAMVGSKIPARKSCSVTISNLSLYEIQIAAR